MTANSWAQECAGVRIGLAFFPRLETRIRYKAQSYWTQAQRKLE